MLISKLRTAQNLCNTANLAESAAIAKPTGSIRSRLRTILPFQELLQKLHITKPKVRECENVEVLQQYMNLELAREILAENKHSITTRDAALPPPKCGLLAIVAYTAGHLDRKIAQMEQAASTGAGKGIKRAEFRQLASTKALIAGTVSRIQKIDAPIVRRNVQLPSDTLAGFTEGHAVQFDRLTSVTCHPEQVYTGGNVDFVIHTAAGVVSIDPLSHFKNNGAQMRGGEAEGLLDLDSRYQVINVIGRKENGKPSLDKHNYPERTIVLQELDASR